MTIMLDGINSDAAAIAHENPAYVAGYIDGAYAWSQAEWDLFPHAVKIQITVTGKHADVADCENGDLTPKRAADWVKVEIEAGQRPTVYCNLATVPAVREATGSYVAGRDYDIWVADWTGAAHPVALPGPGASANAAVTQYLNEENWDVSCINDSGWPHRTAVVKPPASPSADLWPAGVTLRQGSTGSAVKALQYALRDSGLRLSVLIGTPDGDFGPDTAAAVVQYEKDEGLTVDAGIAGPQVRASMVAKGYLTSAGEGR